MYRAIKRATADEVGRKYGFRSGLERSVQTQLEEAGLAFEYEKHRVAYVQPAENRKYTPDFVLFNGIVVETKGRFLTADRKKIGLIRKQFPNLDFRMVFSNPKSRISKTSKTTYAMWCEKQGIPYAKGLIPQEWLDEPPEAQRLSAVLEAESG